MSLPKARESLTRLATLQQATSLKLQQWQSEFKGASSPTYFREPSRPDDGEQVIRDLQQAIKDQEEIQDAAELEINQYCKSVLPSNDSTGLELQQQITVSKANFERSADCKGQIIRELTKILAFWLPSVIRSSRLDAVSGIRHETGIVLSYWKRYRALKSKCH